MPRISLRIDGMSCQHCAGAVQTALASVEGVEEATVFLEEQRAVVEVSADRGDSAELTAQLVSAVQQAGYRAAPAGGRGPASGLPHQGQ